MAVKQSAAPIDFDGKVLLRHLQRIPRACRRTLNGAGRAQLRAPGILEDVSGAPWSAAAPHLV